MMLRSRSVSRNGGISCVREKRGSRTVSIRPFYHGNHSRRNGLSFFGLGTCSTDNGYKVNFKGGAHAQESIESWIALLFLNKTDHLVRKTRLGRDSGER